MKQKDERYKEDEESFRAIVLKINQNSEKFYCSFVSNFLYKIFRTLDNLL